MASAIVHGGQSFPLAAESGFLGDLLRPQAAKPKGPTSRERAAAKRGEPRTPIEAVIASVVTRKVQWELAPKGPEGEDDAEAPDEGKTTKGKVGAAVPGKGKTAKP